MSHTKPGKRVSGMRNRAGETTRLSALNSPTAPSPLPITANTEATGASNSAGTEMPASSRHERDAVTRAARREQQMVERQHERVVGADAGPSERPLDERRASSQDRRSHAVRLTTEGGARLEKIGRIARQHQDELCASLTDTERAQLRELLDKIAIEQQLRLGVHPTAASNGFGITRPGRVDGLRRPPPTSSCSKSPQTPRSTRGRPLRRALEARREGARACPAGSDERQR